MNTPKLKLPVFEKDKIELVSAAFVYGEPNMESWVTFLLEHAPGWVSDALLGRLSDEYASRFRKMLEDGLNNM